ncbi:MAG: PDZ domain-containing protein, partial [Omnitrophica bacterium]|nr:PDZ domain-containing protein [Candidatus Omnitrophota bacterium]
GSPAEKAGLQVGDKIKRVNKKRFYSHKKLSKYLNALEEGKEIAFKVKRGRKARIITVVPDGERPVLGFSYTPKKYYLSGKSRKETQAYLQGTKYMISISTPRMRPSGILYAAFEIMNLSGQEIIFDPSQVRLLAGGAPLKWLTPEGAVGRIKKELIDEEMFRYPIRRHRKFKARINAREKLCSRLSKESLEKTNIKPYETARGFITFDNPFRITELRLIVKVGDETFRIKFDEF